MKRWFAKMLVKIRQDNKKGIFYRVVFLLLAIILIDGGLYLMAIKGENVHLFFVGFFAFWAGCGFLVLFIYCIYPYDG